MCCRFTTAKSLSCARRAEGVRCGLGCNARRGPRQNGDFEDVFADVFAHAELMTLRNQSAPKRARLQVTREPIAAVLLDCNG
jgi:hypothetical protein